MCRRESCSDRADGVPKTVGQESGIAPDQHERATFLLTCQCFVGVVRDGAHGRSPGAGACDDVPRYPPDTLIARGHTHRRGQISGSHEDSVDAVAREDPVDVFDRRFVLDHRNARGHAIAEANVFGHGPFERSPRTRSRDISHPSSPSGEGRSTARRRSVHAAVARLDECKSAHLRLRTHPGRRSRLPGEPLKYPGSPGCAAADGVDVTISLTSSNCSPGHDNCAT